MKRGLLAAAAATVVVCCAAAFVLLSGDAPRTVVYENELAYIRDDGFSDLGTITARYKGGKDVKIKLQVEGGGRTQNYNLDRAGETLFTAPLHGGGAVYTVRVLEQVEGTDYRAVLSEVIDARQMSATTPFLSRNSMVHFIKGNTVYATARSTSKDGKSAAEKAGLVFDYVTDNITYDAVAFSEAESGYISDPETTLSRRRGFCLDYAALMCAMLRSVEIPAKLCVGDAGGVYHAWVSAYIDGEWTLFDPTFVSSQHRSDEIMAFVSDASNYTVRYEY